MRIESDESSDLISSDKVEGTAVYGPDGEKIGSVNALMIGKRSGNVTDAVISVGGFLGMGGKFHSVPWSKLEYDTSLGGYRLDVTEDQLREAPTFGESDTLNLYDRSYQQRVYSHYGVQPYW